MLLLDKDIVTLVECVSMWRL